MDVYVLSGKILARHHLVRVVVVIEALTLSEEHSAEFAKVLFAGRALEGLCLLFGDHISVVAVETSLAGTIFDCAITDHAMSSNALQTC